jgi:chemotaxis protein CheD
MTERLDRKANRSDIPVEGLRQVTVGIAEMAVSTRPEDVLITYSLGSCIALSLYDPVVGVGGLIHCMLPLSKIDSKKAIRNPCMFTDTGVPRFLQAVLNLGAHRRRLVAKLAGAATLLDKKKHFRIGERNHAVMRKILWKNSILISGEEVGGLRPRTMKLYMANGLSTVRIGGREIEIT